ncbi:MAG: response regulator [Planctomycetes bacterium]|nr:response regulator [Planctomycetota bacterium]
MDEERLKTTLKWLVRSGRKTWRILHIEDDPHQLRAVRDSLHEFAAVCPVATVADARVLTKDGDFDLVILDPAVKDAGSPGREPAFPRPDGSLLPLVLHAADAGGLPGSPSSESLALLVRAVRTHLEKQDRSAVEAPRSGVRV